MQIKLTTQATFWLGDVYYKLKAFNLAEYFIRKLKTL